MLEVCSFTAGTTFESWQEWMKVMGVDEAQKVVKG